MRLTPLILSGCLALALMLWTNCAAAQPPGQAAYERQVLPLLQKYCGDCHAADTREERWAFDSYARYAEALADKQGWGKAKQLVASRLMPPHGEESPADPERQTLLDWIENAVFYVDPSRPDPGTVRLRRLNRAEYNNTVRDVLGVASRPADQFPEDDSGYGFDNIADVLSVSPLHVEKYLAAARQIAEEVTRLQPPPRVGVELAAEQVTALAGEPQQRDKLFVLRSPNDEVGTTIDVPVASVYRVLTRAAAVSIAEERQAAIEVLCDGQPIAELKPTAQWKGRPGPTSTVFALVELPAGEHRIGLRAVVGEGAIDEVDGLAAISFLGISGPFTPVAPPAPPFLKQAAGTRPWVAPILRLSGEDLDAGTGRSSLDTGRAWFSSNGYRHAPVLLPETGEYRVRFKVGAQQAGDDPVRFEARLGDVKIGPFDVTAAAQAEQWVEATCRLPRGEHDWQVWFINEYKDPDSGAERWFWLHEFTIEGPLDREVGLARDQAAALVVQTARRLFRRPLSPEESEKLVRLLDDDIARGQTPQAALRVVLEALLASPRFLYHPRPKPAGDAGDGTAVIDELTLASRLSYFLWSSGPDEELLTLAERGQLRGQLAPQVRRMIADPKSAALTENFAGQWLQLRNLAHAAPDPQAFPEFSPDLAADMRRETELLFEHILRGNRSAVEFLDADYTFVNARLARHYGLPEPAGEGFTRVSLAGSPRRGVVTHGSVLTITSHPTRTSPVKRGKWVLEQLLGTEAPPAPPDVPPLDETRENESLPLRARLEAHRENPACAACHAVLDPPGFALEHYDAIGRWRTVEAEQPIDASGRLITGEAFADWQELRSVLVQKRQEDFVRCLTEQLLTYAVGRGITYHDKPALQAILDRTKPAGYGFQDLILAVCESVPMQRMRVQNPSP